MRNNGLAVCVTAAITIVLCLSGRIIQAQDLRGERIDLHVVKNQTGIVTRVQDRTAWVALPQRIAAGQTVSFLFYSDGGDRMAEGKIAWASPVAPYEAYVAEVHAVATRHPVHPYDSIDAFEIPTKRRKSYSALPEEDANGVPLARGMFAHTSVAATPPGNEAVEPVRAHIAALRALKPGSRTAVAIADAAASALTESSTPNPQSPNEDGVNYVLLADHLDRYQKLQIDDPVVSRLLRRLLDIATQNNGMGAVVPTSFMRSPGDANANPGIRRP